MQTRIASAGTGKTTYLIARIIQLTQQGTPLRRIAAVTYTRRAANDLKLKLRTALEELHDTGQWLNHKLEPQHAPTIETALRELDGSNIGTIHAFLANLLRLVAPAITLDPDFSVIGESDAIAIYREEAATYAYLTNTPIPDRAMSHLEQLFQQRSLATTFNATHEDDQDLLALYETLMRRYATRLDNRALAPSDLERKAVAAASRPKVLQRWRERLTHVIVDESQDLNPVQGAFLQQLEKSGIQIEAVGDPKQSIYAFRHADLDTFRRIISASEQGEPLNTTYRHSRVLTRFLNGLTKAMGENDRGFTQTEAPNVDPAREEHGSLSVHWVASYDHTSIDKLRHTKPRSSPKPSRASTPDTKSPTTTWPSSPAAAPANRTSKRPSNATASPWSSCKAATTTANPKSATSYTPSNSFKPPPPSASPRGSTAPTHNSTPTNSTRSSPPNNHSNTSNNTTLTCTHASKPSSA